MSRISLQYRQTGCRQPRRGQALLLAVLIMIFAALLSASFIAIVSVNLNQTARQVDKNRSIVAAEAGMKYVKEQLAYSNDGDKWRNELENVPPAPGDADYAFYYTPMEVAQGWARTTPHPGDLDGDGEVFPTRIDPDDERLALVATRSSASGKLELVKSPDPRTQGAQVSDAPTFLSQVRRAPLSAGVEYAGSLEITVIGISTEDPTAYTRSVSYFGGSRNAPVGQTPRTVSNWDFLTGQSLVGQANPMAGSDGTGATPTLPVINAQGDFTKLGTPFSITVSNPRAGVAARSAVVTAVVGTRPNFVLTLAQPITPVMGPERVEAAANFGAPQGIDYDNNPATPVTPFNMSTSGKIRLSDGIGINEVDGARINASLVLTGDLLTTKLRSNAAAFAGNQAPGNIFTSGVIALDATTSQVAIDATATPQMLRSSEINGIFTTGTPNYQLVSDGWNRLSGRASNNSTRNVRDFRPPTIDSGDGVERYRNLTRFSTPLTANRFSGSLNGYGQGIYIDNLQDKEKVFDTTLGSLREMTQSELVEMWLSPTTSAAKNYSRVATTIDANNVATASLEQQHLRGWVGPDEFRGRGVEIELSNLSNGTAILTITRDPRDDNRTGALTNALGPLSQKAWKADTATGATEAGIYRKSPRLWPVNGVLFAEGNVRIKGKVLNAPRSLTVVSMGNIYIEDSLSADSNADGNLATGFPRKILLLAKKNVVMNPTRVLGRPDAQTIVTNTPTVTVGNSVNITVPNTGTSDFRVNDFVETSSSVAGVDTISSIGQITSINSSATSMTVFVRVAPATQIAANSFVRSRAEQNAAATSSTPFKVIRNAGDAMQRRFNIPAMTPPINLANVRIALNHGADRIPAMKVETEDFGGGTKPASGTFLSNKRVLDTPQTSFVTTATNVSEVNKRVRGDFSSPSPAGTDSFPATAITAEPSAQNFDLTELKNEMELRTHLNAPVGWKYKVTLLPTATPLYSSIPFFYLAGIGNRYDFGATPPLVAAGGLIGWQGKIANSDVAAGAYDVPVATSISMWVNGPTAPAIMSNENWNGTAYDQTGAFGFDPTFLNSTSGANREDILTGDQGFYQTSTGTAPVRSTLDSRSVGALNVGLNSFTLRQNALAANVLPAAALPDYRMLGMKLEDVALTTSNSTTTKINSGHIFDVNAFVYAQNGSWFVIPGPTFESRLHGDATQTFMDLTTPAVFPAVPDAGEYLDTGNGTWDVGEYADLNRNGTIEDSERYAMTRYARYNYQINFTGAISENQTALVNDVVVGTTVTAKGAVADWMNKWATTTFDSTAATQLTNDRIKYIFDPTVVLNGFQQNDLSTTPDDTDYGFRLPQVPEVFNVS